MISCSIQLRKERRFQHLSCTPPGGPSASTPIAPVRFTGVDQCTPADNAAVSLDFFCVNPEPVLFQLN
jgi:hypothetical protein